MWLYNGSGRSVPGGGLFHSALNTTNGQKGTPELLGLPAGLGSLIASLAVVVLGVVLVVVTRGRLGYEPQRAAPRTAEAGGLAGQPGAR